MVLTSDADAAPFNGGAPGTLDQGFGNLGTVQLSSDFVFDVVLLVRDNLAFVVSGLPASQAWIVADDGTQPLGPGGRGIDAPGDPDRAPTAVVAASGPGALFLGQCSTPTNFTRASMLVTISSAGIGKPIHPLAIGEAAIGLALRAGCGVTSRRSRGRTPRASPPWSSLRRSTSCRT